MAGRGRKQMCKTIFIAASCMLAITLAGCDQVAAASPADSGTTAGRSLQIRVSSSNNTYACHGDGVDSVQVTGNSNTLRITGKCGSLQVTGMSNTITVDRVGSIQFTGNSNSVFYHNGAKPTINDLGDSNSVAYTRPESQARTAAAPEQSGGKTTVVADGDTVVTSGDGTWPSTGGGATGAAASAAIQAANAASEAAAGLAGQVNAVQNTAWPADHRGLRQQQERQ
jgi:hypothetical protein